MNQLKKRALKRMLTRRHFSNMAALKNQPRKRGRFNRRTRAVIEQEARLLQLAKRTGKVPIRQADGTLVLMPKHWGLV